MNKGILYAGFTLMIAGCNAEGWTSEYREQYLTACRDSPNASGLNAAQRDAYCKCALEETMKHYSNITEVVENKDSTAMNAATLQCRASIIK